MEIITGQGEGKSDKEIYYEIARKVMQIPDVIGIIAECMLSRGLIGDKLDEQGKSYCDGFLDGSASMLGKITSGHLEIQITKKEVK